MSNYVRQKDLQKKTDDSIIIVGDINNPFSERGKSCRQKISKGIAALNTINQLNIIDTYRLLHPTTAQYTFCSSSYGLFSKTSQSGP